MAKDIETDTVVYFFYETGGDNKDSLHMSLGTDDPGDVPVAVSQDQFALLEGLEAFAPDKFRWLMNCLVESAERMGYERGRRSTQSHKVPSGLDSYD